MVLAELILQSNWFPREIICTLLDLKEVALVAGLADKRFRQQRI